jgi:ATP-dependent exoDNAse (exonuclease V) beta subunit
MTGGDADDPVTADRGPSPDPVDRAARAAIAEALDDTLVVEAAAGTGKTTELVNRILRVLETGRATIDEIVAVTFTEKAAGELKLRLRETLEARRSAAEDDVARTRVDAALAKLEEAHVNTIHGFCADLLRERPVEAFVDPLFTVLTEAESRRVFDRAFRAWLEATLADPPEGVRRALRRSSGAVPAGRDDGDGPIGRLRSAGWALVGVRDLPAPWRRPSFDRSSLVLHLVGVLNDLAAVSAKASSTRDSLFVDLDGVRRLSQQIQLEQSFGQRDLDGWEARLIDLLRDRGFSRTRKGSGYKYSPDVSRHEVLSARDAFFMKLMQFRDAADGDLAAALQADLRDVIDRYETMKVAAGVLDFTDLLSRARHLIVSNDTVRAHLQGKFRRIFVDEFQDTDPIQADILLLLCSSDPQVTSATDIRPVAGKLFIVGDPKQSIYGFRGTDVETYWRVIRQLERHGGRVLQLTTSYRSVPAIQRFVNAAFRHEMVADDRALQPDYVPLSPSRVANEGQPAIVALPVPRPYSSRGPLKASPRAIEASLPDAVGAYIEWLVDLKHGWQVTERDASGTDRWVPLQPRHVAILFRRFTSFGQDVTRPYVDAIEARGIPHLLVGGKAFHGRDEVEAIRAAMAAIEWPDDELSLFATLKGALFAIEDAHLLEYKAEYGPFHPFRIPKALGGGSGRELALTAQETAHLVPIASALRLLQDLHRGRNYRPVADTIGRLLTETRAHVGFMLRPAGEQALANVLHVAELARQYEAAGGISFRGFIDELRSAVDGETAEAPILEETSQGVRIMTVHKAKGLEFPVVILADLTCRMSRPDASRYVDAKRGLCALKLAGWAPHELHDHEAEEVARDRAEGVRLAYVAATRARDVLVVPALGDERWEGGWLSPLNTALYPSLESRRQPTRASKCPVFGSKDSVMMRPNDEPAGPTTVSPGQHGFPDEGGYSVVWWDPTSLHLGASAPFGVRREDLIVKDVPKSVVADGRAQYDRWAAARLRAREAGLTPSLVVATVGEWTRAQGDVTAQDPLASPDEPTAARAGAGRGGSLSAASDVVVLDVASADALEGVGTGGATFGTLVHAILAVAPFESTLDELDALASTEARVCGLTEGDAAAAARKVARVLGHELIARARRASGRAACRRETPVTVTMDDGTLVEGVVDLAFEEDGRWVVVDYKTDRELSSAEERYRRQVALYASAIAATTGKPTSAVIVRV